MLNFALVGCGKIAKRHSNLLGNDQIKGAKLVAVCDVVEENAKSISEEFSVPYFLDMHEMMQSSRVKIDIVVVLTASGNHAKDVSALAKYGKDIVVEKPMALSLSDADKMIEDCKNANIKFDNVSFQYKTGKDSAVKNIDLNIQGEKITALVGHSGAGKSTIMNLIPRFYQQQKGKIFIDEQSIDQVSLYSLRNKISLVSQDIVLFDDSVENNIKYARFDASDDEIKKACQLAAADEFIESLPEKYKTAIGENGVRLSGGQKQRLSIARAILKDSPIILLDEATSSLDTESEEKVQNAIFNLTKNKTTLVIAHRLSTIKKADNIIVMKEGNIVGAGKHDELLKKSEDYSNLYNKQVI